MTGSQKCCGWNGSSSLLRYAGTMLGCAIFVLLMVCGTLAQTPQAVPYVTKNIATGLSSPYGVAVDGAGNIYIGESTNGNALVKKVDAITGTVSVFGGGVAVGATCATPDPAARGTGDAVGDGCPATQANFNLIRGLAVYNNWLYVSENGNNRIRRISLSAAVPTGKMYVNEVELVVGGGTSTADGSYNTTIITSPYGIAIDVYGNVFWGDGGSAGKLLRMLNASDDTVHTIAGSTTGTVNCSYTTDTYTLNNPNINLNNPYGLSFDADGNLYVAEKGCNKIRVFAPNPVTHVVDGTGAYSTLPITISSLRSAVSAGGHDRSVYYTTGGTGQVGKINFYDASTTYARKIGGSGTGCTINGTAITTVPYAGCPAPNATFDFNSGGAHMVLDSFGNMYAADYGNSRIVKLAIGTDFYGSAPQVQVDPASPVTQTVLVHGPASMPAPTTSAPFSAVMGSCTTLTSGDLGLDCPVSVTYTPTANGYQTGTLVVGATNIPLDGYAKNVPSTINTTTVVTHSPVAPISPADVTLTATVTALSGTIAPTGLVTFTVDGVAQAPSALNAGAGLTSTATLLLTAPAVGAHTVTADYAGVAESFLASSGSDSFTVAAELIPLVVTADDKSMMFGGALPTFTFQTNPAVTLVTPPTCTTTATSSSVVGTYPITCSGAADPSYSITYVAGTLTINPASVTVVADDQVLLPGGTMPAFTFHTVPAGITLTTLPTCTATATEASAPGRYPITCSGGALDNYNISYTDGTLTIQAQLGIATTALPPANTSNSYYFPLAAVGGTGTYTWQLAPGSVLPDGLQLSSGIISGRPTTITPGTPPVATPFTVRLSDGVNTVSQTLSITVLPPGSHSLVINQIYGGGGNTASPYPTDYAELFNAGPVAVDLQNWTLQLASPAGPFDPSSTYPIGSLDAYTVAGTNYPAFQMTYSPDFTSKNCNPAAGTTQVNAVFPPSHCWLNPGQYLLVKITASATQKLTGGLPLVADLDLTAAGANAGPVVPAAGSQNWIGHNGNGGTTAVAVPGPSSAKVALVNGIGVGVSCPNNLNAAPTLPFAPLAYDLVSYFAQLTAGTQAADNCWEGPTQTTITNPNGTKTPVVGGMAFYASSSNKNFEALVRSKGQGNGSGLELGLSTPTTPCGDTDNNYTDLVPVKIGPTGQANWTLHNGQQYVVQTALTTPVDYTPAPCTQADGTTPLNTAGPQVMVTVDQPIVALGATATETLTVRVVPSSNPTSVRFNVSADVSSIPGAQSPFTASSVGIPDGTGAYVYTGTVTIPTTAAATFNIPVTVTDDAYRTSAQSVTVTVSNDCQVPSVIAPSAIQMPWNTVSSPSSVAIPLAGKVGFNCAKEDVLVYNVADQPAHGTVVPVTGPSGSSIAYTPAVGFSGQDSFSFTIADTSAANGPLNSAKATVSITVAATGVVPTLTVQCPVATYDGSPHGCSTTLAPFVPGSTSVTYNGGVNAPTDADTYPVAATFTASDPAQNTTASGTLVINAAVPTLILSCPTVPYDTMAHGCTAQVTGIKNAVVSGTTTITYDGSTTQPSAGGTYAVSATFVSSDPNYTGATATGSLTIYIPVVTITANAQSVAYGAVLPALSYTANPSIYLAVAPTCVSSVNSTSGVGTYAGAITCSGAEKVGVNFTYVPGTLTVTPAAAVVTANDQTMAAGASVPALTFTVSPTGVTFSTAPTCTTTATTTSPAGSYPVTCSGGVSANYALSYVAGTLTVVAAPIAPNPSPSLASVSPGALVAGSAGATLTITGANFVPSSTVRWNGSNRATTFVSSTQLTATIPGSDLASIGTGEVTVVTPAPAGGISSPIQLSIDSASSAPGTFSVSASGTFTVVHGRSTTVSLTLNSVAAGTPLSVVCYNLPPGSSCSYNSATRTVTITTASSTPTGRYQVLLVCTTNSIQTAKKSLATRAILFAMFILPVGLFSLAGAGRMKKVLFAVALFCALMLSLVGCGNGSTPPPSGPTNTASAQASATISLTVN